MVLSPVCSRESISSARTPPSVSSVAPSAIIKQLRAIWSTQKLVEIKLSQVVAQISTNHSGGVLHDLRTCTHQLQQLYLRLERESSQQEELVELQRGLLGAQLSAEFSSPTKPSEEYGHKSLPRGFSGLAYAATPGQHVFLEPSLCNTLVYDEWNIEDILGLCPRVLFAYALMINIASGIALVLGSFMLFWEPIVIMVYADVFDVAFEGRHKSIQQGCVVVHWMFVVSGFLSALDLLMLTNYSVARQLCTQSGAGVLLTTLFGLSYVVQATYLCPDSAHVGWLIVFIVLLILVQMSDAVVIHLRLRMAPKDLQKFIGGGSKVGALSLLFYWMAVQFVLCDAFRHYMIIYSTHPFTIYKINVPHPVTKNIVETTNHSLAQETYIPTIIFYISTLATLCTTGGMGHVTAILKSQFTLSQLQVSRDVPLNDLYLERSNNNCIAMPSSEGDAPHTSFSFTPKLQHESNAGHSTSHAVRMAESDATFSPSVPTESESTKVCCARHVTLPSTTNITHDITSDKCLRSTAHSPEMVYFPHRSCEKDELLPSLPASLVLHQSIMNISCNQEQKHASVSAPNDGLPNQSMKHSQNQVKNLASSASANIDCQRSHTVEH